MDVHLHAIATGGQGLNTAAGNTHAHFASARQAIPQISSRSFFRALDRAVAAVGKYASLNNKYSEITASIHEHLEDFSINYEAFISDQSAVRALPVLRSATPLLIELETMRRVLTSTVALITNFGTLSEEEEIFSIFFPDEQTMDEIAAKLNALQAIFNLVASLTNSQHTSTVRLLRLEYGSFLAELAVSRAILKIARPWISGLAGFFYRTRTVEGNLDAGTTASRVAIKQALDVRQLFQKAGIDTTDMDAQLEEAGTAMARNVATLIGNQVRFTVDGEDFHATRANLQLESRIVQQLLPPR